MESINGTFLFICLFIYLLILILNLFYDLRNSVIDTEEYLNLSSVLRLISCHQCQLFENNSHNLVARAFSQASLGAASDQGKGPLGHN